MGEGNFVVRMCWKIKVERIEKRSDAKVGRVDKEAGDTALARKCMKDGRTKAPEVKIAENAILTLGRHSFRGRNQNVNLTTFPPFFIFAQVLQVRKRD